MRTRTRAHAHPQVHTTVHGALPGGLDLLHLKRCAVPLSVVAPAHSARRRQQQQQHRQQARSAEGQQGPRQAQQLEPQQPGQHQEQQEEQQQQLVDSLHEAHEAVQGGRVQQGGEGVGGATAGLHPGHPLRRVSDASPEFTACGWMFHPDDGFDKARLAMLLAALQGHVVRMKGIFRQVAGAWLELQVLRQQRGGG